MIRTLLATTAVAAVLALPVIAQDASSSMESSAMESSMSSMESSAMDSSAMSSAPSEMSSEMSSAESEAPSSAMSSAVSSEMSSAPATSSEPADHNVVTFDISTGYTRADSDRLVTRIVGAPVYDTGGEGANKLGDIEDLVLDQNGCVVAVVLGVGGFLGIGEKHVTVSYPALTLVVASDQTERFVVETTVEELTAAPDFVIVEDTPAEGGDTASQGGGG